MRFFDAVARGDTEWDPASSGRRGRGFCCREPFDDLLGLAHAHTVYAVASDGQGHAVFTFPAELRVTPVAVRDMSYSM